MPRASNQPRKRPRPLHAVIVGAAALLATVEPAAAQRADENAIADAEDAFGSNDGGEDLGLYGPFDVRGFSPVDAGNVRIEGIYIDRTGDLSPRLVEGSRIRVGPSAANYAFPAPSGVVDYRLRMPGRTAMISGVVQANSFGGGTIEVDASLPITSELSVGGGFGHNRGAPSAGRLAAERPDGTAHVRLVGEAQVIGDVGEGAIGGDDHSHARRALLCMRYVSGDVP